MEENNKLTIIQELDQTPTVKIVDIPRIAERFKALYTTFNGRNGAQYYQAEKFHFAKLIQDSADLQRCTKLSLYGCFLDTAVNGLSFDPAMGHLYMYPYKVKVAFRNEQGVMMERWEERAKVHITGAGELLLRTQQGQIKYADNPILVYEGDVFSTGTRHDKVFVEHEVSLPRKKDAEIMACYLKITRNDDTVDYKVLTMPEIERLRACSNNPNSLAWTTGLPGMVGTKTIKHAFKSYPKMRILVKTKFTELASDIVDEQPELLATEIYESEKPKEKIAPVPPANDESFIESELVEKGVVIDADEF